MISRRQILTGSLALAGCGGGGGGHATPPLALTITPGGIPAIRVRGQTITTGNGYYWIASCSGADDTGNIWTVGASGQTTATPKCPAVPFLLESAQATATQWLLRWTIGPLPATLPTASVPLDFDPSLFTTWRFDPKATRVQMGCGASWQPVAGREGAYTSIVQPCTIPGAGQVGAVVADGAQWIEAEGPVARVRRTFMAGDRVWWIAYNHPSTHNIEAGFVGTAPGPIAAGRTLHLTESLEVV